MSSLPEAAGERSSEVPRTGPIPLETTVARAAMQGDVVVNFDPEATAEPTYTIPITRGSGDSLETVEMITQDSVLAFAYATGKSWHRLGGSFNALAREYDGDGGDTYL
jgi:hypothetical protein